jgi:hypothetical protein
MALNYPSIVQGTATTGLNLYQDLKNVFGADPRKTSFVDPITKGVLFQADSVLSESHERQATPTVFPLEDGSTISDHIFVTPLELSMQCIVTDAPLNTPDQLAQEAIVVGLSAIEPPLAVTTQNVAYSLWKAHQNTPSRSTSAFAALLALQAGDPTARPPVPPKLFNVVAPLTRGLKVYENMVIKSFQVQRDAQTGYAIVFQLSLAQLTIVSPQTIDVAKISNKALASDRAKEAAEEAARRSGFQDGYNFTYNKTGLMPPTVEAN